MTRTLSIEEFKSAIDETNIESVSSAAKRFAEMERKNAEEAKKAFPGSSKVSNTPEITRKRVVSLSLTEMAANEAKEKQEAQRRADLETKRSMSKATSTMSVFDMHLQQLKGREQADRDMGKLNIWCRID
jgi:hypothetical protein